MKEGNTSPSQLSKVLYYYSRMTKKFNLFFTFFFRGDIIQRMKKEGG